MDIYREHPCIQFSEANGPWQDIPEWARFLVMFGYQWHQKQSTNRRIALISMPCDSAAAGLVALGAVRKFLEDPDANDVGLHLQRIRSEQNKILLHRNYPRSKFRYCGKSNNNNSDMIVQIKNTRSRYSPGPLSITFQPKDVCFQGEPFLEVVEENELPNDKIYRGLVRGCGDILTTNLRKTHSSVCLAGRNLGENATRDVISGIQLRYNDISAGLYPV